MKATIHKGKLWMPFFSLLLGGGSICADSQSLVEAARREAERRELLEQQGVEGKVIQKDAASLAPNANVTISSPSSGQGKASKKSVAREDRASVRTFRRALQKLDHTIRQDAERLELLRARLQAERWALPKVGRVTGQSSSATSQERLRTQIQEIEIKLKRMRQERLEIYEEGKKAGYLPGELEGKGIIP